MKTLKGTRPYSLAFRVTLFVGLAIGACLFCVGWIVERSIENHFADQDADELGVVAEAVQEALSKSNSEALTLQQVLQAAVSGHHGVYFRVNNSNGSLIYASPGPKMSEIISTLAPVPRIQRNNLTVWEEGGEPYRGAILEMHVTNLSDSQTFTVAVASAMEFHLNFLTSFRRTLWSVITAATVLIFLASWFAVRQGHAPLHNVTARIRSIRTDQLSVRLDPDSVPIELLELVSSFNDMLSRIEEVFQQLSNFSADIAHELRTPLTNLTTQTQVAVSKARTLEEYREILYSNLEEYERLSKMINDMLWLAKTDNGLVKPVFEALDPFKEIHFLFDYFEAWAEEQNVQLKLTGQSGNIQGDRSMFRRALSNLLANSIRHAKSDSQILVTLHQDANNVVIDIENAGEDIPDNQVNKIFDRFYRIDPSRQRSNGGDGVGLGLSIVRSIIAVHGGEVTVISKNGVTIFTVKLPVSKIETLHQS